MQHLIFTSTRITLLVVKSRVFIKRKMVDILNIVLIMVKRERVAETFDTHNPFREYNIKT